MESELFKKLRSGFLLGCAILNAVGIGMFVMLGNWTQVSLDALWLTVCLVMRHWYNTHEVEQ